MFLSVLYYYLLPICTDKQETINFIKITTVRCKPLFRFECNKVQKNMSCLCWSALCFVFVVIWMRGSCNARQGISEFEGVHVCYQNEMFEFLCIFIIIAILLFDIVVYSSIFVLEMVTKTSHVALSSVIVEGMYETCFIYTLEKCCSFENLMSAFVVCALNTFQWWIIFWKTKLRTHIVIERNFLTTYFGCVCVENKRQMIVGFYMFQPSS